MTESNVDMLRLEYPRTALEVYNDTETDQPTIDLPNPTAWVRLLVTQHQQAQWDLEQLHGMCGDAYDRADRRIVAIERNYQLLTQALEYVYKTAEANTTVSHEWMQTELIRTASAAQKFTTDVWTAITARDRDQAEKEGHQITRITRLNDAVQFLQVADCKRAEEQQTWNANCEKWAMNQQEETERLAREQQRLRTEVSAIKRATTTPTYLQSALPKDVPLPASREGTPEAAGGGAGGEPPRRPRTRLVLRSPSPEPENSTKDVGPSDDDDMYTVPGGRRNPVTGRPPPGATPLREGHIATMLTPEEIARLVGEGIMAARTDQRAPEVRTNTSRLKLKNPEPFDGKPTSAFNIWWESVLEYIGFYPETLDTQKIAWVGTLLSDTAKAWHQHRRRTMADRDTWARYTAAIRAEFRDTREAANAQLKLSQLRYKGDIKAYFTEFRALNVYAQATGEGLREKVDQAMPDSILDMRFAHYMEEFIDDEHFLTATYNAGLHVERRKALKATREAQPGGSTGRKDGPDGKGPGNARKGKESGGPKQVGKSDSGGKAEKPRKTWEQSHWGSGSNAYKGVPQSEIDSHRCSKANCWRCGRDSHTTQDCYAQTTVKGTELPEAPKKASSIQGKRKREEDAEEAPAPKQTKNSHVKIEDEDMREAAAVTLQSAWQDDSDF